MLVDIFDFHRLTDFKFSKFEKLLEAKELDLSTAILICKNAKLGLEPTNEY